MAKLFANSENPDQTLHFAASDLGLHCLPITLLAVSRLQWVKEGSAKDLIRGIFEKAYAIFFSDFHYKNVCCGYPFELNCLGNSIQMSTYNIGFYKFVEAIQMHTHNIYFYKVDKYAGCNLKTTKLLDNVLIWGGRVVGRCCVSHVTGVSKWYWLTVWQGLLSL